MKTVPGQPEQLEESSLIDQERYSVAVNRKDYPSQRRYNITISHSHQFIWFRVAKAGTRTLLHHLSESGVQLDVEHASNIRYPVIQYGDYYKFAFVRNPWCRLVSCWMDKVVNSNAYQFSDAQHEKLGQSFAAFISFIESQDLDNCDRHFRRQTSLIDINNLDFLGRMESFECDVRSIFSQLRISIAEIASKNASPGRKRYQEYYSPELASKVEQLYLRDVQVLGYSYEQD